MQKPEIGQGHCQVVKVTSYLLRYFGKIITHYWASLVTLKSTTQHCQYMSVY